MASQIGTSSAPPRGWVVAHGGVLTPDPTVAGYLARGREVRGLCHQRDCHRRCQIDFPRLAEKGLGGLWVHELKPLFKCSRLGGCSLEFQEQYGAELTLRMLADREFAHVKIACGKCQKAHVARPWAVIAKLKAEGTGGPETRVDLLAGLIRGPCAACKTRRWDVSVYWFDSRNPPLWARLLAKEKPEGE